MKVFVLVVTALFLWVTMPLGTGTAFAASDGYYQLTEIGATWEGTEANRTKAATTGLYDYTYGDESSVTFDLPWGFNFYGQAYDQIKADTNGNIWFTAADSAHSFNLSDTKISPTSTGRGPVIALWNNDLSSYYYGGVFIQRKTVSGNDAVVVEWQTETYTEKGYARINNYEAVLFPNGTIRFDYKPFDTESGNDFGSGISKGDGQNYVSISDNFGSVPGLGQRSFNFTLAGSPVGVRLNPQTAYVTGTSVNLSLWCRAGMTCSQMKFSTDNSSWTEAEAFATAKTLTLPVGDGTKSIYVKVMDNGGAWYTAATDSVVIDSLAPVTSATPVGGSYYPLAVTLSCSDGTGSGCGAIFYTTDGSTPTTASKIYSVPVHIGATTTLNYFSKDNAGNVETLRSQTYTINDTDSPIGSVAINANATNATSATVALRLACSDTGGCSWMRFSNDNSYWTAEEPFATGKTWTLSGGDGNKTVYVQFKDGSGNWSTVVSDTVMLDTAKPVTTATPAGAPHMKNVTVSLTCSDTGSTGCRAIHYTTDGTIPTATSPIYLLPLTFSTTKTLKYFAIDKAGNVEDVRTQLYSFEPAATAPAGLTATALDNRRITLTWTNPTTDASGIYVEKKDAAGNYIVITTPLAATATTYTSTGLAGHKTYDYRVRAYADTNPTTYSDYSYVSGTTMYDPDLVVTAVNPPSNFGNGQTINVPVTVKNLGPFAAGSFEVRVCLSADSATTCGTGYAQTSIGTLAVNAEQTVNLSLTIPTVSSGTYFVVAVVDPPNIFSEADETNNRLATQVTVTNPDLIVTAITPPATVGSGQSVTVPVKVKNQGESPSGYFYLRTCFSTTSTITTCASNYVDTFIDWLGADTERTVDVTVPIPAIAEGTYYMGAVADVSARIFESVETNNTLATQVTVTNPDLIVTAITPPASVGSGQSVTVPVKVKNQGPSAAGYFYLRTCFSTTSTITTCASNYVDAQIYGLAANTEQTVYVNLTIPAIAGEAYYLGAVADVYGSVLESIETNNFLVVPNIDLLVTSITAPGNVTPSQQISIPVSVKNEGTAPVPAEFLVSFHISTDSTITSSDIILGSTNISALAAGATQNLNVTGIIPSSMTSGTYYLGAIADAGNVIAEYNEANNVRASATAILPILAIIRNGSGTGVVTSTPAGISCGSGCSNTFMTGTAVTLTATPAEASNFIGWSGAGCSGTGNCTFSINSDTSVTATFAAKLPVVDFSAAPTTGVAPTNVTFTDLSQYATSWLWDFGDGTTSTSQNPSHLYRTPGTYNVSLTATNGYGSNTSTRQAYISVTTCPNLPVRIVGGASYTSLQEAYNAAAEGDQIQCLAQDLVEDFNAARAVTVTVDGGYTCNFGSNPGLTVLKGTTHLSNGIVTLKNIRTSQ